ncbi:DUF4376 domain-containing protein [Phascolarctobacterium succinatutens]|jgi:hypothetical protein|uniref:DUF4376 domain-containing protein n=1 Tax=Phascolarctobacterium succinatutens TaxID=626940 RepID=UPI0023F620B6|nr:DUF4376 domain-containing protein [Phascolarctobacterium succinatutens]
MKTTYTYKEQSYSNLYELSEVLGKDGVFIPLSISEESLKDLGVTVTTEEESLESVKEHKILTLKIQRDNAEVQPIEYRSNLYDYDEKARDRINAAIIALELQGEGATIEWTTADNADTPVTANDLKMIIAAVAVRSNKLHTAYRVSKEKVEAATTAADVETVIFKV